MINPARQGDFDWCC